MSRKSFSSVEYGTSIQYYGNLKSAMINHAFEPWIYLLHYNLRIRVKSQALRGMYDKLNIGLKPSEFEVMLFSCTWTISKEKYCCHKRYIFNTFLDRLVCVVAKQSSALDSGCGVFNQRECGFDSRTWHHYWFFLRMGHKRLGHACCVMHVKETSCTYC